MGDARLISRSRHSRRRGLDVWPDPGGGDELPQLLFLRKDCAHVRAGATAQPDATPAGFRAAQPHSGRSEPANGYPDAEAVGDAGTFAESACHETQPKSRVGGGDPQASCN
jgi:hypothetical protein